MSTLDTYLENNKSGKYHLGRMFMDCLQRKPPDEICQIDAFTGLTESNASVLRRSVRLARGLRTRRLLPGDVLALGGRNHLDLHIPYYAALMTGLPIVGVDPFFKYDEIKTLFKVTQPKIAFCDNDSYDSYKRAAEDLGIHLQIVTFGDGDCTMADFIEMHDKDNAPIEDFEPTHFDTDKVYAWLISTSGTTGKLKVAAIKHQPVINKIIGYLKMSPFKENGSRLALNLSSVQWFTSFFNAIGLPLMNYGLVQTSGPDTTEHIIDMINKYKPVTAMAGPALFSQILRHEKHCDFTCFDVLTLTGSKLYKELITSLRARVRPGAIVFEGYGQTETLGPAIMPHPFAPLGSCGVPSPACQVKLMNQETGKEVTEPNVMGELWVKGTMFSEYYNDPEETAKAFSEDGWFRTGDLLYRDEKNFYYFGDRAKMLIKYGSYHVSPLELEEVISSHPGVLEVGVAGVPHPEDGQHPVACVVARPSCDVTAEQIKQIVADKLSATKQLRGGVIFVKELPKTSAGKVNRAKLTELAVNALKK